MTATATNSSNLGDLLRARRMKYGLSGKAVGLMVRVDPQTVWLWERGKQGVSTRNMRSLYRAGLVPLGLLTGIQSDMEMYAGDPLVIAGDSA